MGKMKLKKLLSFGLTFCLASVMLVNPAFATEQPDITLKIESSLREQLENAGGDESVDVMIWFTDIDHEAEKAQIVSAFEEKIASGELPPEVIDMFQLSKDSQELDGERIKEIDSAVSTLEMQDALMTKRQISAGIYAGENQEKIDSLFEPGRITEENSFISHYSPCLFTSLTKNEIYDICGSDLVEEVYAYTESEGEEEEEENLETDPEPTSPYTTFQFDDTGITQMRDTEGFTGEDVKVGVCDKRFAYPANVDYMNADNIHYNVLPSKWVDEHSTHGNLVAYLIGGHYVDPDTDIVYDGAAPDAEMYLAATGSMRGGIEYLVDQGVNVLDCSMAFFISPYNSYDYYAKWIDHVASQHNINMVMSAGNQGSNGITDGSYGYNSIIVGSRKKSSDDVASSSSYCNLTDGIYKPDLIAPGSQLVTPAYYVQYPNYPEVTYNSGTSFAAPVVAGAVAQLCQASSTLAVNPRLMKAVVLAGATISNAMISESIDTVLNYSGNTSYEGFNRKSGAGILNVINSYHSLTANRFTSFTSITAVNPYVITKHIYLTENSLLRFVDVWDVTTTISGTHTDSNNTPYVNWFQTYNVSVRTPSGIVYNATPAHVDSKKICTFETDESGYYSISIAKVNNYPPNISHGMAFSIQSPITNTQQNND